MSEKVSRISELLEQMVDTRMRISQTGKMIESLIFRLCGQQNQTVQQSFVGYQTLAGGDYMPQHDSALMIVAVKWAKQEGLKMKKIYGAMNAGLGI